MTIKTFLALGVLYYFTHLISSIFGVFILSRVNLGDIDFDLKRDIKRMAICSLISLPVPMAAFYIFRVPHVMIFYIVSFWVFIRFTYIGITILEFITLIVVNYLTFGIFILVVKSTLLLYLYILIILILMMLYFNRLKTEKSTKRKKIQFEQKRRLEIRDRVKREPDFQTFCFECKYFDNNTRDCSLDTLEKTKDLRLKVNDRFNTYCLYWEPFSYSNRFR